MRVQDDFTVKELTIEAGYKDESAIRHLIRRGVFPNAYKRAGAWFIPRQDAQSWLAGDESQGRDARCITPLS